MRVYFGWLKFYAAWLLDGIFRNNSWWRIATWCDHVKKIFHCRIQMETLKTATCIKRKLKKFSAWKTGFICLYNSFLFNRKVQKPVKMLASYAHLPTKIKICPKYLFHGYVHSCSIYYVLASTLLKEKSITEFNWVVGIFRSVLQLKCYNSILKIIKINHTKVLNPNTGSAIHLRLST